MVGVPPSGAVTFLFTDIEGSTRLWQLDAVAMAAALARHDEVITENVESHDGQVFKHTGDGMCAVFPSALMAVKAATAAQDELELPVRMGIHTGEAQERDGDFFGPTLNRCARLMDAGHGGQTLLSVVSKELVGDVRVRDLGEYQLKDLALPERIYQIGEASFPPLRVRDRRVALPAVLTSLVGRDQLVSDVTEAASTGRLVTLVGVGGVGKTRVALAAAEGLADQFDRTVFVDLSLAADEAEVVPTLGRALELVTPSRDAISIALTGRRVLVVLDNCEHVIEAAADLVSDVLAGASEAVVIATSREGLAVDGERLVAVPGLDSGDAGSASVALFVDRARAATGEFVLDESTTAPTIELCRHLDGIPLAIELAASRMAQMSVQELVASLDDRFRVLTGGRRRRSRDRHRTLRETIDWSHELLDEDERRVFARLSVFGGSFDLVAAAAVLDDDDDLELLDIAGALVDKSMLMVTRAGSAARYRFLETIRTYAEEQLEVRGQTTDALRLLTTHLATLVRGAVDDLFTGGSDGAARIRSEVPNLRRALDFAIDAGDVGAAAALIEPLAEVWANIDWSIDGWADEILELPASRGHASEPALLVLSTVDRWLSGAYGSLPGACQRILETALGTSGPVGHGPWWLHRSTALFARIAGANELALQEAARAATAAQDEDQAIELFARLSIDGFRSGIQTWRPLIDEGAIEAGQAHSSRMLRHASFLWLTDRAHRDKAFDDMLSAAREATEYGVEGAGFWFASLQQQALALLKLGRLEEALHLADIDLEYAHQYGDRSAMLVPIGVYAIVLMELDEATAAATLRGWIPPRLTVMLSNEITDLDHWLSDRLPPEQLDDLKARGRLMTPHELQALGQDTAAIRLRPDP